MTVHELKTWPQFFDDLLSGRKEFEVRQNDRPFRIDDVLRLREYDPISQTYTGREHKVRIHYLTDLEPVGVPGFVAMGIHGLTKWSEDA